MIGVTFVSKVSSASRGAAIADDDADDEDDDWDEYVDEGGSSDEDDSSESLKKHRQNKLQQWADVVVLEFFFRLTRSVLPSSDNTVDRPSDLKPSSLSDPSLCNVT